MMITLSWVAPNDCITPITRNNAWLIRSCRPIEADGSGPKSAEAINGPSTTTCSPRSDCTWSKNAPTDTVFCAAAGKLAVVPITEADRYCAPGTEAVTARLTWPAAPVLDPVTNGTIWSICGMADSARTSSSVSGLAAGPPGMADSLGTTVTLFAIGATAALTELVRPWPNEVSRMTAATPMINPSMVSPERSLLDRRARMAMATMSRTTTATPPQPLDHSGKSPTTRS